MVPFASEWFELGQIGERMLEPADHGVAIVNLLAMDHRVLV